MLYLPQDRLSKDLLHLSLVSMSRLRVLLLTRQRPWCRRDKMACSNQRHTMLGTCWLSMIWFARRLKIKKQVSKWRESRTPCDLTMTNKCTRNKHSTTTKSTKIRVWEDQSKAKSRQLVFWETWRVEPNSRSAEPWPKKTWKPAKLSKWERKLRNREQINKTFLEHN